jgi:hypothetical protein
LAPIINFHLRCCILMKDLKNNRARKKYLATEGNRLLKYGLYWQGGNLPANEPPGVIKAYSTKCLSVFGEDPLDFIQIICPGQRQHEENPCLLWIKRIARDHAHVIEFFARYDPAATGTV